MPFDRIPDLGNANVGTLSHIMLFAGSCLIRQLPFFVYPVSKGNLMKRYNVLRLCVMALLVAVGVVISPLLRIEGMCPMAHLINITAAVLLGPLDAFFVALTIGIIRMCALGIPPLALTGAVFGALLSGILYKVSKEKIWAAVLGEIIGTGIIGAIVSYPVMTYLCGREGLGWFFYVPSFTCGTLIGGTIAAVVLYRLKHIGALKKMQTKLSEGGKIWKRKPQNKAI